jgi:hypothetical protein
LAKIAGIGGVVARAATNDRRSIESQAISFASTFVGLSALGAAAAYFSGWQYERAYAQEWGIPFSALQYDPYELMTASSQTVFIALSVPIFALALTSLRSFLAFPEERPSPEWSTMRLIVWLGTNGLFSIGGLAGVILGLILLSSGRPAAGLYMMIFGNLAIALGTQFLLFGSGLSRSGAVLSVATAAFLLIVVSPGEFGRSDAERDRSSDARLPLASIYTPQPLGLPGELNVKGDFVSGPWKLIRVNNGNLWVTRLGGDGGVVIQMRRSDVSLMLLAREGSDLPPGTPTIAP